MSDERAVPAVKALAKILKRATQAEVARTIGVTPQNVGQWVRSEVRPGQVSRTALQRAYGIPLEAWLTAEERAKLRRQARAATPPHTASDFAAPAPSSDGEAA